MFRASKATGLSVSVHFNRWKTCCCVVFTLDQVSAAAFVGDRRRVSRKMVSPLHLSATDLMTLRREVLSLYRQVIRLSRSWQAKDERDNQKQREYIVNEARRLFRENKSMTDEEEIKRKLQEGRDRLEVAKHYQNPYPRLSHFATGASYKKK